MAEHWVVVPDTRVRSPLATPKTKASELILMLFYLLDFLQFRSKI